MKSMYLELIDSRKEIDQLHDLVKMVWKEYYGPIMGEGKVNRFLETRQSKKQIQEEIATGASTYYFIYNMENQVIGYLAYHFTKEALVIDKLYLIYSVWGRGLSHEIMNYLGVEAAKRGITQSEIFINEENQRGINIFKHYGYEEFTKRRTPMDQGYVLNEVGLKNNFS